MSTRARVVSVGILMVVLATAFMGLVVFDREQSLYEDEVRNQARVLLAALAVPCVSALAENHIEELDRVIEEFKTRLGSASVREVAVLDHQRRVVGHTEKSMYGRVLNDPFSIYAASESAATIQLHEGGDERVMQVSFPLETALAGLPGIRWGTLLAELDLSGDDEVLMGFVWRTMRMMVLFAVLTGLLLYTVAERLFFRPVSRLAAAADALRDGNLGARAKLDGKDEMATLGQTFDRMAEALEKQTETLHELVDYRTRELHKANRELMATMEQLKEANEQLESLARTDALTGLANRRHLKETLAFHFALARRGERPLAFVMVDVDHFKNYNDTHGHPEGDKVLRTLSDLLRKRVRQTDVACRYGGEEFAIMFPDTELAQAELAAEAIRKRVEYHDFPHGSQQPGGRLTVSIGVAALADEMQEPMDLVARADAALYEAKRTGRNRVVCATTLAENPRKGDDDV